MGIFHDLKMLVRIQSLVPEWRRIVFYSEGKTYWGYLNGIISELLEMEDAPNITYITSDSEDPGHDLNHRRFRAILIETDRARDWFFANIDATVMVTTTPDLGIYQFRRSHWNVHYVYLPHSLISLHMAYRAGAFDAFDTLFCAGPHHLKEARALERLRGSKPKTLVQHGYDRVDVLIDELKGSVGVRGCILIAPSWGPDGLIETLGEALVQVLLDANFQVILRPHPQTSRLSGDKIDVIQARFGTSSLFSVDFQVGEWCSLGKADVMISDWSGVALEYAAARRRPVLFIDTPKKCNNSDYMLVATPPVEIVQRDRLGVIVHPDALDSIPTVLANLMVAPDLSNDIIDSLVYNRGHAAKHGARYLTALAQDLSS
jgi:hypothetical protein